MGYLNKAVYGGDAESAEDAVLSSEALEQRLQDAQRRAGAAPEDLSIPLEQAALLIDLDRGGEAWAVARETFDRAMAGEHWERAVEACDLMYRSEQPDSIPALAHGIWLGVTFPIDPELSVAVLEHLVDETPPEADGALVAGAAARFLADVRAEGRQHDDLMFFTSQLMGEIARRHRGIEDQETFDTWVEFFELDNPDVFLPRLAQVLDALVGDGWWYDRDALRARIPEE